MESSFRYKTHTIITIGPDNDLWINGKDVCRSIGYENSHRKIITELVDDIDVITLRQVLDKYPNTTVREKPFTNRELDTYFISRNGLYALIYGSKLPEARQFNTIVCSLMRKNVQKEIDTALQIGEQYKILFDDMKSKFFKEKTHREQLQQQLFNKQ